MSGGSSPRLLKRHDATAQSARIAFNYDDLRKQCEAHLAETQAQVEALMQRAAEDAEQMRSAARAEGFAEGRQAGLKDAHEAIARQAEQLASRQVTEQLRTTLPALERAIGELQTERDRWLARWEAAAVRLSMAVAEKLIRSELSRRSELFPQMVTELLQLAAGSPQIEIRLHPEDLRQLHDCGQDVLQRLGRLGEAQLLPDPTLARGDCVVQTRHGEIDSRLSTQLARIEAELLDGSL